MEKYQLVAKILVILLVCASLIGCAGKIYTKDSFPGWTWIGSNSDSESLYIDKTNIRESNGNALAWFTMTMDGGDYVRYYLEIECTSNKFKVLSAARYDERGNVKEALNEEENWRYASINTAYFFMIKEACK